MEPETRLAVGRFTLDSVTEFQGPRMLPAEMFPALDGGLGGALGGALDGALDGALGGALAAALLAQAPAGSFDAASGKLVTSVHSWLVRGGDGLVMVVDTCSGNDKERPHFPIFHRLQTDWLPRLAALGVTPEQVTHVVNTHLHHDHVGWNTILDDGAWRPTFPNARYLMPLVELEAGPAGFPAWNGGAFEDGVAPILRSGLSEPVTPPYVIAPGLTLIAAPGHSPGMMVLEIADGRGGGVLAGGDPMHHAIQAGAPELNTRFCQDPAGAAATRLALLGRCADAGWGLAAIHFRSPRVLHVRRDGARFVLR